MGGGAYGGQASGEMSATGRMMGQHEVRATKLEGADVKSSSGQDLGTISDVIVNTAGGKVDFAVLSLNPSATGGTSPSSSSESSSSSTSATGGQLVAIPWSLLRPSTMGGATPSEQPSFVYNGDAGKLQSAPTFSESNWPDISQPGWRHSIYSYFGMSPGTATGGATTPGGTSSGGSSEQQQPQQQPQPQQQ
jgi:sporulation protein YlmC with PRC-barrel domain